MRSQFSIFAFFGPVLFLVVSLIIGGVVANYRGLNEFSFAVIGVYGFFGTVAGLITGAISGFIGIKKRERFRILGWVALVAWPAAVVFLLFTFLY